MNGITLSWFQWMLNDGKLTSWNELIRTFEIRFAPSQDEDTQGSLFKLIQTSSIDPYQTEFESLSISSESLLRCFIRLRPSIRRT